MIINCSLKKTSILFLLIVLLLSSSCRREKDSNTPKICYIKDNNLLIGDEIYKNILQKDEEIILNSFQILDSNIFFFSTKHTEDNVYVNTLTSLSMCSGKTKKHGDILFEFEDKRYFEIKEIESVNHSNSNEIQRFFTVYKFLAENVFLYGYENALPPRYTMNLFDFSLINQKRFYQKKYNLIQVIRGQEFTPIKINELKKTACIRDVKCSNNGNLLSITWFEDVKGFGGPYMHYVYVINNKGEVVEEIKKNDCHASRVSNDGQHILLLVENDKESYDVYLSNKNNISLLKRDCQDAFFYESSY
jgi:hypothetical protein